MTTLSSPHTLTVPNPQISSKRGSLPLPNHLRRRDQLTGEKRNSWKQRSVDASDRNSDDSTEYSCEQQTCDLPLEFVDSLVVKPDLTFKILIVGNPHVGKSCFLMRLCTNTFAKRYASTIG
jgi:ribosome biogenesis GTPase A